jgi:hypothetical protein
MTETFTSDGAARSNDNRFDDYVAEVRQYGRDEGDGNRAKAKFFVRTVQATVDGLVDLTKDKHGKGVDDASFAYAEYLKQKSKKTAEECTDNGTKANVSKLRVGIKLGSMTTCDPVGVMNRAITKRAEMVKDKVEVRPEEPSLINVAREQLQHDSDLSDEQLEDCICKADPKDKTLVAEVEVVRKKLEKIITGEGKVEKCQDERIIAAHDQLKDFLATLTTKQQRADDEKLLAEVAARLGCTSVVIEETETVPAIAA